MQASLVRTVKLLPCLDRAAPDSARSSLRGPSAPRTLHASTFQAQRDGVDSTGRATPRRKLSKVQNHSAPS